MGMRMGLIVAALLLGVVAAQEVHGPVRIAGGVVAGQIVSKVNPVYPQAAREQGVQGMVVLHAIIGKNGMIENLAVVSGPEMLQAAAVDAVRQWVYKPYLLNGEPTEVDTAITVNFQMGGGPKKIEMIKEEAPPLPPPESDPGAVRVSGGVMAGQILTKVDPFYPPIARAAHVSGAVSLHAVIGADGTVRSLEVVSGPEMLRSSALYAVRQWTYRPYLLNGEATAVNTTIIVNFADASSPAPNAPAGVVGMTRMMGLPADAKPGVTPTGPARISGAVMAGAIVSKVAPVYPQAAREQGVQGAVVLHAIIGKDGLIRNLRVVIGPEVLQAAAVDAVQQWVYKPYLLNGEPTEVDTTITVNFSLSGGGGDGKI